MPKTSPPPQTPALELQPAVWQACLSTLAKHVSPQQIKLWLVPLQVVASDDESHLTIYAKNRVTMDFVRGRYRVLLEKALELVSSSPVTLSFTTGQAPNSLAASVAAASQTQALAVPAAPHLAPARSSPPPMAELFDVAEPTTHTAHKAQKAEKHKTYLNPSLTFDTLVSGKANETALLMGQTICLPSAPSDYNPLFIYGASGLGKTHLMHAIGHAYLKQHPQAKVLYIHADKFVNDVVTACRIKNFGPFKERYHSLNLLMIDDVQQFSNKEKTLEEFFNAFETLLSKKAQIILTSDTYPKELSNIPERLISRLNSGLNVKLSPPEVEMRVAILHQKAEEKFQIKLPQDVAWFIAHTVASNVRELEGALKNVVANTRLKKQNLNIHTAREVLKDLISAQSRQISVENIQRTVADYYRLSVSDLQSKGRKANIVKARHVAMFLAKELTQKSLPALGAAFGRDHTTVLHAVKKITNDREADPQLEHDLHILEQSLRS